MLVVGKIDRALVTGEAFRAVAERFGPSATALFRHKANHIPVLLAQAQRAEEQRGAELYDQAERQAAQETAYALDVMAELRRCFERVNLLFDACDRWLRDADDPSQYDIGPRASELLVTYETVDPATHRTKARKEPLSTLLARTEEKLTVGVTLVETKQADPRELVLKTADRLRSQTELLAKLLGDLDDRPQVNVLMAPEWLTVRAALLEALRPYPDARQAVAARLAALDATA